MSTVTGNWREKPEPVTKYFGGHAENYNNKKGR